MNRAKILSMAVVGLLFVAGCTEGESWVPPPPPTTGTLPISFDATTTEAKPVATSRTGEITTANLTSMGVFASYTGTANWSTSYKPNFMFNQKMTCANATAPWQYTPIKYWPNTANEKITFFAYAPYGATGVTMGSNAATTGYPVLKYKVPTVATSQTDLLAAAPLTNQTKNVTSLNFSMKHVMTRILVYAKCTQAITMKSVQLNDARDTGNLTLNGSAAAWSGISATSVNFAYTKDISVSSTTQVAEFFMLPHAAKSITITYSDGSNTETKTALLPATPAWKQGTAIAYTLNIESGSELTLTVKNWDTNTNNNGNMGQDVPSGTQYPYIMNGVLHESATKSYYVGEAKELWYDWEKSIEYCAKTYNKRFPAREWRLPNNQELRNLLTKKDVITGNYPTGTSAFWSATASSTTHAYYAYGRATVEPRAKTDNISLVCIRDMGEITVYPTYRIKNEYNIIYLNASTTLGLMTYVPDWQTYKKAVTFCDNSTTGGYTDWRLPTKAECDLLIKIGEKKTNCMWSSTLNDAGTQVWAHHKNWTPNWGLQDVNTTAVEGGAYCVRSY